MSAELLDAALVAASALPGEVGAAARLVLALWRALLDDAREGRVALLDALASACPPGPVLAALDAALAEAARAAL